MTIPLEKNYKTRFLSCLTLAASKREITRKWLVWPSPDRSISLVHIFMYVHIILSKIICWRAIQMYLQSSMTQASTWLGATIYMLCMGSMMPRISTCINFWLGKCKRYAQMCLVFLLCGSGKSRKVRLCLLIKTNWFE